MPVRFTMEIDTAALDRLLVNSKRLDGEAILFGIPAPSPMHTGKPGKPARTGLTCAQVLAWIEFGVGKKPKRTEGGAKRRKPSRYRRLLGRVRALFARGRRGRPMPGRAATTSTARAPRPVIRWVAAARREIMVDGFKSAAKRALAGFDPRPDLELLAQRLADATVARIVDVGAVDTGQTAAAVSAKIVRRYGPDGGGPA